MVDVNFYFQVHQPFRIRKYTIFEIGYNNNYFDEKKNKEIFEKVAKKCYLPANKTILELIHQHDGKFNVTYSITGTALEQMRKYSPNVLDSFQDLAKTGCVEFLSETMYHSLSCLFSEEEFKEQVEMHKKEIFNEFRQRPTVFRNTELIMNNHMTKKIEDMGYEGVIAEGADHILGWRSPNYIYNNVYAKKIKLLLKNYRLSDDIAFRFSQRSWKEWPLTAEKFSQWVNAVNGNGHIVNLFMDYETFGEHQWEDTGIFHFLRKFPELHLKNKDNGFTTPSSAIKKYPAFGEIDMHNFVSWADIERDLTAWLGNHMQNSAIKQLYMLEKQIKKTGDQKLIDDWRKLQTSDHFYFMCTKWFADGDVHKYFSPYESPYDAYINFMNCLNDIIIRLKEYEAKNKSSTNNYAFERA